VRYLIRIKGRWYFNMRVPKDLIPTLKLKVIKKSLSCTHLKTAKILVKVLSSRMERLFLLVRCGLVNDDEVYRLIEEFKHDRLRELDDLRLSEGYGVPDEEDMNDPEIEPAFRYGQEYLNYDEMREQFGRALVLNDLKVAEDEVNELLEKKGVILDKASTTYKKLCREMLKVWVYIADIEQQRIVGNFNNEYDLGQKRISLSPATPTGQPDLSRATVTSVVSNDVDESSQKDMLLSEALEEFIREKRSQEENPNEETYDEYRSIHKIFRDWVGDVPLRQLERRKRRPFIEFAEILKELPKNMNVIKEYRGKPVREVLEMVKDRPDVKRISGSTKQKYMIRVHALMAWCEEHGYIDHNYASNLAKKPSREEELRLPYSIEQLQRLLDSPVYHTPLPTLEAHKFWIPLIALFTGMRMNEICQLHLEDIRFIKNYHCIDINKKTPDKKVKSKAGRRIIPIHPTLIDIGFLRYVEHIRKEDLKDKNGYERLWPGLRYEHKNYKHRFSKWYAGYCDDHVTDDHKIDFHSFRHTFISNLENEGGVHDSHVAGLVGHTHKTITFKVYGHGYEPQHLVDIMSKLNYKGLNLKGIKWPVKTT